MARSTERKKEKARFGTQGSQTQPQTRAIFPEADPASGKGHP